MESCDGLIPDALCSLTYRAKSITTLIGQHASFTPQLSLRVTLLRNPTIRIM
jgi:hypothetical protein